MNKEFLREPLWGKHPHIAFAIKFLWVFPVLIILAILFGFLYYGFSAFLYWDNKYLLIPLDKIMSLSSFFWLRLFVICEITIFGVALLFSIIDDSIHY